MTRKLKFKEYLSIAQSGIDPLNYFRYEYVKRTAKAIDKDIMKSLKKGAKHVS